MGFRKSSGIESASSTQIQKAYCPVSIATQLPCSLYFDASGVMTAINQLIDASSRKGQFGVLQAAVSSGDTGSFVVRGLCTVAGNSGTSGNLITAISAAGTVTDATAASANADLALGVSTGASTLILY